jgi:hypothetical protein
MKYNCTINFLGIEFWVSFSTYPELNEIRKIDGIANLNDEYDLLEEEWIQDEPGLKRMLYAKIGEWQEDTPNPSIVDFSNQNWN